MGKFGYEVVEETAEKAQSKRQVFQYLKIGKNTPPKQVRFITVDEKESILTYAEHYVKFNNDWSRSYSCPDFMNDAPDRKIIHGTSLKLE